MPWLRGGTGRVQWRKAAMSTCSWASHPKFPWSNPSIPSKIFPPGGSARNSPTSFSTIGGRRSLGPLPTSQAPAAAVLHRTRRRSTSIPGTAPHAKSDSPPHLKAEHSRQPGSCAWHSRTSGPPRPRSYPRSAAPRGRHFPRAGGARCCPRSARRTWYITSPGGSLPSPSQSRMTAPGGEIHWLPAAAA